MKKTIIFANQRGFMFKNGRFEKLLDAGKHYTFGDSEVEVVSVEKKLQSEKATLATLLADPQIASQTTTVEVQDRELGLHYIDGKFAGVLTTGKYAFWNACGQHTFRIEDISTPWVASDVPTDVLDSIPLHAKKVAVPEYAKARLYFNKALQVVLEPGTYYFWRTGINVDVDMVDTRLTQMNITGQEVLTRDKVGIRVNLVISYRIADCVCCLTEVDDYAEQLHVAAQLAMREYVGRCRLDEILEAREEMSEYIIKRLKEKAPALYLEVVDGGVKDIILPGEIRAIMNTVLTAEKKAQASVITRREEVASTRSLLNTAKLMEENKTLYKLKELEYLERICENVGNINLNGGADMLAQLSTMLRGAAS